MTQPKKAPFATLVEGWDDVVADVYSSLSENMKRRVRLEDGHLHFTVRGVGATTRNIRSDTKFLGCNISLATRQLLMQPGYDNEHRLTLGRDYELVVYCAEEIATWSDRTAANIRNLAMTEFGDSADTAPEAEFVFLIRKAFTDAELRMLGLEYMAVLHSKIEGDVTTNQLLSRQKGGDPWVQPWVIGPNVPWEGRAGFAFPLL